MLEVVVLQCNDKQLAIYSTVVCELLVTNFGFKSNACVCNPIENLQGIGACVGFWHGNLWQATRKPQYPGPRRRAWYPLYAHAPDFHGIPWNSILLYIFRALIRGLRHILSDGGSRLVMSSSSVTFSSAR